jgi:ATP-dependent Clp protease ATP-binding subunit ClpC
MQDTDETIEEAVKLSARYVQDTLLPDKAIDILDQAGAKGRRNASTTSPKVEKLLKKIEKAHREKESAFKV